MTKHPAPIEIQIFNWILLKENQNKSDVEQESTRLNFCVRLIKINGNLQSFDRLFNMSSLFQRRRGQYWAEMAN